MSFISAFVLIGKPVLTIPLNFISSSQVSHNYNVNIFVISPVLYSQVLCVNSVMHYITVDGSTEGGLSSSYIVLICGFVGVIVLAVVGIFIIRRKYRNTDHMGKFDLQSKNRKYELI